MTAKNLIKGNNRNNHLNGTQGDDKIEGLGGWDTLNGNGGNDHLIGGAGLDNLYGGAGADVLNGTDEINAGAGERDHIWGGAGADTFILGDANQVYYIDAGKRDFARIQDFEVGVDKVQLSGHPSDYHVEGNKLCLANGELIAIFENLHTINLNSGDFVFTKGGGGGNTAPNAVNDSSTTEINIPVNINVLGNDSDPDGDSLSVTSVEGQSIGVGQTINTNNGSVTLLNNGQLQFSPDTGFTGNETFSYHVSDGNGGEDTANVTVKVEDTTPVDPQTARIGNKVFLDANQNGIFDSGEVGVAGVRVELTGAGSDGVLGTGDDISQTQTTNGNGTYSFRNLAGGDYKVTFSNLPNGLEFTAQNVGNREGKDSDADPNTGMTEVITLAPGETNNQVDAGLIETVAPNRAPNANNDSETTDFNTPVSINVLGNDSDLDGDPLSVTSVEGQSINPGQTIDTDNGSVTLLNNGQLEFTPDAGFSGDETFSYHVSDGNGGEDTANVTVTVEPQPKASIGDRVWYDNNGNGIQDAGEGGVPNVNVELRTPNLGFIKNVRTDANGNYKFDNLNPGDYRIDIDESTLPAGFKLTTPNAGGNDAVDSDADPTTGWMAVTTLSPGEHDNTWDAGIVKIAPPPKVNQAPVGGSTYIQTGYANAFGEPGVLQSVDFNIFQNREDPNISFHATRVSNTAAFDPDGDNLTVTGVNGSTNNGTLTNLGGGNFRWTTNPYFDGTNYGVTDFTYQISDGHETATGNIKVYVTPLALDLNGNGIQTLSIEEGVEFDMLNSGSKVKTGWLSGEDGFLAIDNNGNGQIDDRSELFGGANRGDGFAKLASFDSNNDGLVNENDALFGSIKVWQDANENGITDAGELVSLKSAGITDLNTAYTDVFTTDAQGNIHGEHSSALKNGSSIEVVDVYFQVEV